MNIFNKAFTGLEIAETSANMVRIKNEKSGWRLISGKCVHFPEETLNLSFRKNNIINPDLFIETINSVMKTGDSKNTCIGLSIPNEVLRTSIQRFDELPESGSEIEKMILWSLEKSISSYSEDIKISYHRLGKDRDNKENLFVTFGLRNVIREYEMILQKIKINAEIVRPSYVNQFNFYKNKLPSSGIIAYLGLFENYFAFFVFEDAMLKFYHGTKKGFSNLNFVQDVDMIMRHYINIHPDKEIKKLYVGSQVAFHRELEEVFKNLSNMEVFMIREDELISTDNTVTDLTGKEKLSSFVSAIGAAQSLTQ